MAAKATRCPHCHTSFRVTEAQLATARGLVRCGACLEVFNAGEHWVESESEQQNLSDPSAGAGADDDVLFDDGVLFDDDNGLPDSEPDSPQPPATAGTESWLDADRHSDPTPDSEPDLEPEPAQAFKPAPDWNATPSSLPDAEPDPPDVPAPGTETSEDTPEIAATDNRLSANDDDDFHQLVYQRRRQLHISRQQFGWAMLSLAAALCLMAQLVYSNFNQLAQSAYRPELASLCNAVNYFGRGQHCLLPPPQNLALIHSRGLNIYSHPNYANSLLVDVLIENQAVFEQPFPLIELEFHDQNGRPVASRRFTPADYLAGELRGMEFMPSRQTVHINISILDPGTTAVNYEMLFHPATGEG